MDVDPRYFFIQLNKYLEDERSGPKDCNQLIASLNDVLIREQISLPDLELYLQCLLNKSQGFLDFLLKIINNKEYKKSILNILEILYTLINNFSTKLEKYITVIYEICFKVIKSTLVSSSEKVKALDVVILSFEKINKSLDYPECYNLIYNDLLITTSTKKCDTVYEKILQALGTFAKHYQYLIKNPKALEVIFLRALETQMQRDFSQNVIAGAFTALDAFCENFNFDPKSSDDKATIKRIFTFIEKLLEPRSRVKTGNRAGLMFLANYMPLFINLLIGRQQFWHEMLLKWLDFGVEEQKVGILALQAFYRELGTFLLTDTNQQHNVTIMYFFQYFQSKLTSSEASHKERHLCLYGISSFSAVYQAQLSNEEIKNLHVLIIQNFEQEFILNQNVTDEVLEDLPFYLQTVGKFVYFGKISNSELFCLQKGAIMIIKYYPRLPYFSHEPAIEALLSTFFYLLSNNEKIFDNFLDSVVYQGVVWSCSHQHISEADLDPKALTVKNYLSFWRKLLSIIPNCRFNKIGIYLNDRKYICYKIIDKLIKILLVLINKLNVGLILNSSTETDIESAYKVAEINDYAIFLNLVDFYEEIFNQIEPAILTKCFGKLIEHLVAKCDQYPLISGFYKLFAFTLKICNKANYFHDSNETTAQDVKQTTQTLTIFIENLLQKSQQYKGDLLIASLQLLLEYPVSIIRSYLPVCGKTFQTVFYLGRNYIKLAHMGLNSLELWQKYIPADELEDLLKQVVPSLDYYLQSKFLSSLESAQVAKARKTSRALKKRKILLNYEPELVQLQFRIIRFIGGLNSEICESLAYRDDNQDIIWGNRHNLKIILPYQDHKLDLFLDPLIPRLTHLALYNSDRKTRIMSCELLQAIVMIFLGTSKQMSPAGRSDLNETFKLLSFTLLKLGCDLDQIVEQIFRPLCFQLVHWYTHPYQIRSDHSAIMIEAILDGIAHPTDSALRDFSGKCINEYVKWTIKQTSESTQFRDPTNIKILAKKMRFYCTHPDNCKKLGAALIFNNIYREIREESGLMSIFWIEFVNIFITSLASFEFEVNEIYLSQINAALRHLERGLVQKSQIFNSEDRERIVAKELQNGTLPDLGVWLLKQTGSPSRFCREKSMEMFCSIIPRTKHYLSLQNFIQTNVSETWIRDIYEALLIENLNMEDPNKWLQALLIILDGYKFIVIHYLSPHDKIFLSEILVRAVGVYLGISTKKLEELSSSNLDLVTTFNKQIFNKQKSQVVLKLLDLLNHLEDELNLRYFYNSELWNLIVNVIFNRESLGFDGFLSNDLIHKEICLLLKDFVAKLPPQQLTQLTQQLETYINENLSRDVELTAHVSHKQRRLIKGLNLTQSINYKSLGKFSKGMIANLLNQFLKSADGDLIYVDFLQDTTLKYCLEVLNFALCSQEELLTFIDFLYKPYRVQTGDFKEPIALGTYFLIVFEDSVLGKLIENFETFLKLSLEDLTKIKQSFEIMFSILSHTVSNKKLRSVNETVVEEFLKVWPQLDNYLTDDLTTGLNFVKTIVPVIKSSHLDCANLKFWLESLLSVNRDLGWKKELDLKIEIFHLFVEVTEDEKFETCDDLNSLRSDLLSDVIPEESKVIFLDKLLAVIPKIQSAEMLIFILEIYAKISNDELKSDVKTLLADFILKNPLLQETVLLKIYDLYSGDFENCEKYKLITNTTSLFQYSALPVFRDFFVNQISEILTVLSEEINSQNLLAKIAGFQLLEVLFLRIAITASDTEASELARAAVPDNPSNKKLLLQLLKIMLNCVKESLDEPNIQEFLRLYKCHSYNAMVSLISTSTKDLNFYTKLFLREENGVEILWHCLIDTQLTYAFPVNFDTIPNKRKILVNIRNELRASRKRESAQTESIRYLESVRVFNSSLSEDFTNFDFSNSTIRSEAEQAEKNNITEIQTEVELDTTDVNKHECMATVCGLLQFMLQENLLELPEEEDYELPSWLNGIRTLLLSPKTHNNVKIFWVKVIDNCENVFRKLARWFLEPLLKFIVDQCAGKVMNYFIVDVVAILATWASETKPQSAAETQLANDLISFLINHLDNERSDVFKYHLDLLRTLIEAWKPTLPFELLLKKLQLHPNSKRIEIGVHLFSIFLANKIFPWIENLVDFSKALCSIILESKAKSAYKPSAENFGLLLRVLKAHPYSPKLTKNVYVLLKKITDQEKFAVVLEAIALHYPEIVDENQAKIIVDKLGVFNKTLKIIYLKLILSRSEIMRNVNDFKNEAWETHILNDELEIQILALEIVHKSLMLFSTLPQFKTIVEAVCRHSANSNSLCRSRMFDILVSVAQNDMISSEIIDLCRPVLVQGLTDSDVEIQDKVYTFWKSYSQIPAPLSERLTYILKKLYETGTENHFLGYSCNILLDIIRKTDDYKRILFEHPLEDCEFENLRLETNWRRRHSSVAPLFAETLRSSSLSYNYDFDRLRATQSYREFEPTQSLRDQQMTQLTMSESSLLVKSDEFLNPNFVELSHKYRTEKRYFYKDKARNQSFFAQREVKKKQQHYAQRKDLAKERESKVTIFRSYRIGDLPDIQITLQAVLEPLQALSVHDGEVSQILFSQVFGNIMVKLKSDCEFLEEISNAIQTVFTNSVEFNRSLFKTLFDVLLKCKSSIALSPDIVVSVAQSSGLKTLGILLLEEYLIGLVPTPPCKRGSRASEEMVLWIKLAELYKEMDEWDIVKTIFLSKTRSPEAVRTAILAESRKQWRQAQDEYKILINSDVTTQRHDFYYESYFKCFAHLGEWDKLVNTITETIAEPTTSCWDSLWNDNFNQQKLLPWFLSGQVKNFLFTTKSSNEFFMNLNSWLNSDRLDYLERNFSEELTMLWIFQEDTNEAEKYLKIYLNNFLKEWQQLDTSYCNIRYNNLLKLRNMIDVDKFLNVSNNPEKIQDLVNFWNSTLCENLPSILFSEEKVLYRKQLIKLLEKQLKKNDTEEFEDVLKSLNYLKFNLYEGLIGTAIDQNNFYLAKKYLNCCKNQNVLKLKLMLSKLAYIRASLLEDVSRKLEILLHGCETLNLIFEQQNQSVLKLEAHIIFFKQLRFIANLCENDEELFVQIGSHLAKFIVGEVNSSSALAAYGATNLTSYLQTYQNLKMETDSARPTRDDTLVADAYVDLAYFVKKQPELFSDFILFVLRAMKFNSAEGRQLFPCVIMSDDFSEENTNRFIQESNEIPIWMFLGWIPQILVNVDSPKVRAVESLILKIAKKYPQAIMYSYRLSKENYKLEQEQSRKLINELDKLLLADVGVDNFLKALSFIGVPASNLLYFVKKLRMCISADNQQDITKIVDFLLTDFFSHKPNSRDSSLFQGNMYKSINRFEKELKAVKDLLNKSSDLLAKVLKIEEDLRSILRSKAENKKISASLKDYSPWLENFSPNKMNLDLEIPGQYDGKKLPLIQHHIKIAGFAPHVSVMSSLRKPIKIIILGHDTKEYPFLVKFGEDVRQDQRIQQLFGLMNNIYETDKSLTGRRLTILTYQVIPLTTNLGMIQWIDNTNSLEEFITKSPQYSQSSKTIDWIRSAYCSFLSPKYINLSQYDLYGRAAMNLPRDKVTAKFRTLCSYIDWSIFKSQFLRLSTSNENYYILRYNFIQSYATMCISHWILGVGDRHLSNSLICLRNGRVLGIDFGYAFGTATQFLPVPELVPIRLTPHLINFMEPFKETGLFREVMIHCLRALRANFGSLLSTMNVFIQEPSLDWLELASRVDSTDSKWYPAQKIDQAERKLKGANPAKIIIEDLLMGHRKNENYMNAYVNLVRGDPDRDFRALKEGNLTVEEQVDYLIDHATDYNLLGRMYDGWFPFV